MTYVFADKKPATGAEAMYNLKELLKSAGWSVKSSSDGTTYNSTGDQITSGSTGANGMANNSAWFRIQCPTMGGVTRELCFQRGTTNLLWKAKYSYSAGFTGGSPGATRVPSATDEKTYLGGGTDAAPTFNTLFSTDATYRTVAGAGGLTDGYTFYQIGYASNATNSIIIMDAMQSDINPLDADGYVFYANSNSGSGVSSAMDGMQRPGSTDGPKAWLRKGYSDELFTNMFFMGYYYKTSGALAAADTSIGINFWDGRDAGLPLIWTTLGAVSFTGKDVATGLKGSSRMMRLGTCLRYTPTLLNFDVSCDRIQLDRIILPWSGNNIST